MPECQGPMSYSPQPPGLIILMYSPRGNSGAAGAWFPRKEEKDSRLLLSCRVWKYCKEPGGLPGVDFAPAPCAAVNRRAIPRADCTQDFQTQQEAAYSPDFYSNFGRIFVEPCF